MISLGFFLRFFLCKSDRCIMAIMTVVTSPPPETLQLAWAHLSVCSHISKTTRSNFTKLSADVNGGHGSVFLWQHRNMSCTYGFADDVMFSHNGANGPESKMTRTFCWVRPVQAPVWCQTTLCLVEFSRWQHSCSRRLHACCWCN